MGERRTPISLTRASFWNKAEWGRKEELLILKQNFSFNHNMGLGVLVTMLR